MYSGIPWTISAHYMFVTCPLNPDKDCSPNVAVRATPSGPLVRRASLTLQCLAVNPTNSSLTYQWLKDGQLLAEEASALLVRSAVEEEDSGVYTCRVSNRVGEGEANVTVTVISKEWKACSCSHASVCMTGRNGINIQYTYIWFHLVGICVNASQNTLVVRHFGGLQLPSSVTNNTYRQGCINTNCADKR